MTEPLFSGDELRKNEQYRAEALELIASGEAIAFVGAGLSIELGYPSWPDLSGKLTTLANEVGKFVPPAGCSPGQAPEYADAVKDFIKEKTGSFERYWNLFGRGFGARNPGFTTLQCDLMRLPLKAVITSNYEPSLELACAHVFSGRHTFVDLNSPTSRPPSF